MATGNSTDMNQVIKDLVTAELVEKMPLLAAQATLIAGNALRAQAFSMTAAMGPGDFIVQPAKLVDGGCIALLRQLKYVQNTYRMIVGPAYAEDGTTVLGQAIVIFAEEETDLVKTQFISLSPEAKKELSRQLKAISLEENATLELCLAVIPQEIEGFEYFIDPDAPAPVTDSKSSTDNVTDVEDVSSKVDAPSQPTE